MSITDTINKYLRKDHNGKVCVVLPNEEYTQYREEVLETWRKPLPKFDEPNNYHYMVSDFGVKIYSKYQFDFQWEVSKHAKKQKQAESKPKNDLQFQVDNLASNIAALTLRVIELQNKKGN